jgi:hypothetical protein
MQRREAGSGKVGDKTFTQGAHGAAEDAAHR